MLAMKLAYERLLTHMTKPHSWRS